MSDHELRDECRDNFHEMKKDIKDKVGWKVFVLAMVVAFSLNLIIFNYANERLGQMETKIIMAIKNNGHKK